MRAQPIEPQTLWEDGEIYYDSILEAQFSESLKQQERPRPTEGAQVTTEQHRLKTISTVQPHSTTIHQLVAGCGVAAVDAYLDIREYAASKGLHLSEIKGAGIDLQDLISTLIINATKEAAPAKRFTR